MYNELPIPPQASTDTPDAFDEARRQIQICNACRYCEGYCDVFPAITRANAFADGDLTQLANLCHNCRGCYYACQYTEPHEFALNLPAALADVRTESWERYAWPSGLAAAFQRSGTAIAVLATLAFAGLFALIQILPDGGGEGFYAYMSHALMVAIFLPAFVAPLVVVARGLVLYWREVDGAPVRLRHLISAFRSAAELRNLSGGQGQGCNFEAGDRYSDRRRQFHQAVLYGFLLCLASTSTGTILHYGFGLHAPYGPFSLPKLFGVPGGLLMVGGSLGLMRLKLKSDPDLGARRLWSGEMGFIVLTFLVAATGLVLYAATGTVLVPSLLALHLGTVLAFFLLMPYSKMVHGFFRLAALVRDAQTRETPC